MTSPRKQAKKPKRKAWKTKRTFSMHIRAATFDVDHTSDVWPTRSLCREDLGPSGALLEPSGAILGSSRAALGSFLKHPWASSGAKTDMRGVFFKKNEIKTNIYEKPKKTIGV